jgi:hypothetical protein
MSKWFFRTMERGELNVDPIQSEFFSTEAIDGLTEALVRESIQNTLDATPSGQVARVRFWHSGQEHALKAQNGYLHGLEDHLHAEGSGLTSVPSFGNGVPFLLIEDYGARGLSGDYEQDEDSGEKNDFYYFWRNVGRSGKKESDRGRWGLGKNVFPASSQINTFFGFTIRAEDPATLLLGQSVLKVHKVGGSRKYPYGYFANVNPSDHFALPISDATSLDKFRTDFHVARTTETGLSIAVLFPDPEITEERILKAVLRQYFYPIMKGLLSVSVTKGGSEIEVNRQTLNAEIAAMDAQFRAELEPMFRLAEWSLTVDTPTAVKQPAPNLAPKWEPDAVPGDIISVLRPQFERGDRLAFTVPVVVKRNNEAEQPSFFRVFLQRDLTMQSHRPIFVREGLIITDAVRQKQRGVRALVVAEDKHIATLLGDSENPAHTEWQSRSAHFKDRYRHGESTLRYVKNSILAIVQMLSATNDEQDLTALADVFFLPEPATPDERRKSEKRKPEPGPKPPIPDPPEPPEPRLLRLTKIDGGFVVVATRAASSAHITAAYEVRRGNAFKRYDPADFEFGDHWIQIAAEKTNVIQAKGNQLVVGPLEEGSRLTVTGFDPARDLVVRVSVEEQ